MKTADFDEWMSGRYWLGDKAPKGGFYGRYDTYQLMDIKFGFLNGTQLKSLSPDIRAYSNNWWLMNWARDVGESLTRKLNENT